jgi:hypothetical protein
MSMTASAQVKVEAGNFSTFGTGAGHLAEGALDISVNHVGAGGASAGDVYVVDTGNSRIEQFSPSATSGSFVRSWGWDVVSSGQHNTGANEQQTVTVRATGGTFSLTVTTASGHGVVTSGSNLVTGAEATLGAFRVGDAFSPNVPAGTTITEVNEAQHKLTLSASATASGNRKNLAGKETTAAIASNASTSQVQTALEALPGIGPGAVTVTGGPGDAAGASPYVITFSAGLLSHNDLAPITSIATLSGGTGEGANQAQIATTIPGGGYEICEVGSSPVDVCKGATAIGSAGGLSASASSEAIDQSNGNIYVADQNNRRIAVFDGTGTFQGAFGYDTIPGGASGTATVTPGKTNGQISAVTTTSKAFLVGQAITGTGIPASTTITAVGAGTITLSNPPTAAATGAGTVINSPTSPGNVAINEQQTVAVNATGGSFKLKFETPNPSATSQTTVNIPFNASAAEVQGALEALTNIGVGNVAVTGPAGGPYAVEFKGTRFADTNVTQMTVVAGTPPLSGGTASVAVATPQEGAGLEFCTSGTSCQVGSAGPAAGQFNVQLRRLSVNPANGHILVANNSSSRVDEFTPVINGSQKVTDVSFARGFGWDVVSSGPDNANQVTAINVSANAGTFKLTFAAQSTANLPFNASAGAVDAALEALPAIGAGNVVVVGGSGNAAGSNPYGVTFVGSLAGKSNGAITAADGAPPLSGGTAGSPLKVTEINSGGSIGFEVCRPGDTCKAGVTSGGGGGQFANLTGIVADSTGAIYALDEPSNCSATTVCRIQKFDGATLLESDFAPSDLRFTTGSEEKATRMAVDFTGDHVLIVKKTTGSGLRLYEFDSSGVSNGDVSPPLAGGGLVAAEAIAVLNSDRVYALQPTQTRIAILAPAPPPEDVTMLAVAGVTANDATFHGKFTIPTPGGPGYETHYRFEYSSNGTKWSPLPVDKDLDAGNTAGVHEVELTATTLDPSTEYLVRLRACTSSCIRSLPIEFVTPAIAPTIALTFSEEIGQTEATLGAQINPRHLATTYHFEWGETTSYSHRIPAFERQIGSGSAAIFVQDTIVGLQPATPYHFRVVATSSSGTTLGPDQQFETLNDCGLTQGRCFELVSPADKGPVGEAGQSVGLDEELQFQASSNGGNMAYVLGYGLPDSTSGGEVVYQASRGSEGWASAQLSPPVRKQSVLIGGLNISSRYVFLSKNLSCGFLISSEQLTADFAAEPVIEQGGANLYRHNADGSYTLVSNLIPTNFNAGLLEPMSTYRLLGASEDCKRAIFKTDYRYPGVEYKGLYEWDDGVLRNPAIIPGSSGPQVAETVELGAGGDSYWNALSAQGSRVFFTAPSKLGGDQGKRAVFIRKDGATAIDVSQSQTATTNDGDSRYQMASDDGSYVFFTARYGLASNGTSTGASSCGPNGAGCDLYRYEVATSTLTDLSADSNPADSAGAGVAGVLDASIDGSHVYFAARGQLVPLKGNTYAQNLSGSGAYNLYRWNAGVTSFVATVSQGDLSNVTVAPLVSSPVDVVAARWSSRSTPDGEHLLFKSASPSVTGYDSGGVSEAYLYSAKANTTMCISCRRDGQSSVGTPNGTPDGTLSGLSGTNPLAPIYGDALNPAFRAHPQVTISEDGQRIFFNMPDVLALGARSGEENLYEWHDGQISLLITAIPGTNLLFAPRLMGASVDGDSVFFKTKRSLVTQDVDQRQDIYVARVGGGFDSLSPPSPPCNPLSEGACQGSGSAGSGSPVPSATSTFIGPGNEVKRHKPNSKKHKKGKKHKKSKTKKRTRDVNSNGRPAR